MLTMESVHEKGPRRTGEGGREQQMEEKPLGKSLVQVLDLLWVHCLTGRPVGLVCQRQRGLSQVAQVQLLLLLLLQRWERLLAYHMGHFANAYSRREREEEGLQPLWGPSAEGAA